MAPQLWTVRLTVPAGREAAARVAALEAAMEPHAVAVSSFEVEGGRAWVVEGLCAGKAAAGRLGQALGPLGAGAAAAAPLPPRDWVAESQRGLAAFRAGRFWVHGSHETARPPRGAVPLLVDAGLAFGTGRHETTRGCLLALDRIARRRAIRRPLDLGCGSGILAIAMAKLWDVSVLAVDNDPQAVAVARENAAFNGVAGPVRAVVGGGYGAAAIRAAAPFDLVAANILARPLIRLAPGLARALAPGGLAILSGLLEEQADAVLAAHRRRGLEEVERHVLAGWCVLTLARPK
ncbi:MAG: 50S ribosomal protein L11 methyltransferase [Dongiaceae bacterium]